jgi:teichuronic acid biosynthesis glycosyltransferase TuaC
VIAMNKKFVDKSDYGNLLIIAPSYPDEHNTFIRGIFIKNQIEALKFYFKNVYVIAPVFNSFKTLSKDKLCNDYSYDNVKVYFPRCHYIPISYFNRILIDNRLAVITSLIKKKKLTFDLIHAHFTWPSGYIGVKLKEMYSTPVVITIHENQEWLKKEIDMSHQLLINTWKNADVLVRVNKNDLELLNKFNKNSLCIPNGFAPKFKFQDKDECRDRLNLPKNKKILFSVGALIERKGFNYLIDSMEAITKSRSDCLCFIGGSGPLKEKLQKQINNLNLHEFIKLVGFIPDNLLPIWMSACDMFVLPSLSEGNPTVMFECLGCGKPFIGTKVGGVPEVIKSNDYGLLVEPGNALDLAGKIEIALNKNWDEGKITNYAEQYRWENIASQIMNIYHRSCPENYNL